MKKTVLVLVVGLLFTLGLAACGSGAAEATPAPAAQLPAGLIAEGRLVPVNSLEQSFGLSGQVAEVLVKEGDSVEAGAVLARLSAAPEAELALARAEQEAAAAQQALDDLIAAGDVSLAQAKLDVLAAQDAQAAAQEDYDADESEANEARLNAATALLNQATTRRQELEENQGILPGVLVAATLRQQVAEKAAQAAQAALDARELRASLAGTVVDALVQPGQRVTAGQPLLTLADFSGWQVKTDNLTEVEVVNVTVGQTVSVIFDALPESEFTGEVTQIGARFEEKRGDITYTVTIALAQTDPQLRWGMTAAVVFTP